MNASTWISRGVSRLRTPSAKTPGTSAPAATEPTAHKPDRAVLPPRTLTERLDATLRRHGEAMAPRALARSTNSQRNTGGFRTEEGAGRSGGVVGCLGERWELNGWTGETRSLQQSRTVISGSEARRLAACQASLLSVLVGAAM